MTIQDLQTEINQLSFLINKMESNIQFLQKGKDFILHEHTGADSQKIKYSNLRDKQSQITRTAIPVDLSGSAVTLVCLHTEKDITLKAAYLLYTEASSADAGITVEVGKESDRDYYYTGTTETGKAIWYSKTLTLLKTDITAGDTITFYSAGGKTGTGEIILIIEYIIN